MSELAATFIGHQGWLVESEGARVLVDPLLTPRFGHGGYAGVLYPPRMLDLPALPPIDAVVITHEHDDHFDLPSLDLLDRRIALHLSAAASTAARDVLRRMGFSPQPLQPGDAIALHGLSVHALPMTAVRSDEWGVAPLLFRDGGGGSVFTSIDAAPGAEALARARSLQPRPGLWIYANNLTVHGFADALGTTPPFSDHEAVLAAAHRRLSSIADAWGEPAAALVCGGGWSYPGERAWMNRNAFPVASEAIAAALAALVPLACAPEPGDRFVLRDGEVARQTAGWVRAAPRAQWPARDYVGDTVRAPDFAPAGGRRQLSAAERTVLVDALADFARYLYGRPAFDAVHARAEPSIALDLLDDADPLVLAWVVGACRFEPVPPGRAIDRFAAGLQCWATDLHDVLVGELPISALGYAGRMRGWNREPTAIPFGAGELWRFAHPLRRPAAAAHLYDRIAGALEEPAVAPDGKRSRVRARQR